MTTIYSFAPVANQDAGILILGSMPGQASLSANQYYAHPQNAFWRIIGRLLQFDSQRLTYAEKTKALKSANIALWDVLYSCQRKGSLDTRIETRSQIVNDFQTFFRSHDRIRFVFFNGGKAEACFERYVLQTMPLEYLQLARLPSTSPANARLPFEQKCDRWLQMLMPALQAVQHNPRSV